ncbi:unnamed protein product, partial [Mesorhabditis spiculigera]
MRNILIFGIAVERDGVADGRPHGLVCECVAIRFSPCGSLIAVLTMDSTIGFYSTKQLKLPGTVHSDKGERSAKPQIAVHNLSFCPTGRRFSVCSTEGVAVYSLDMLTLFDPFQLDSSTSPATVQKHLSLNEYSTALMAALKLNENTLVTQCLEATPVGQIELVCQTIPLLYAERLLKWIADGEVAYSSPHVHFYMKWIQAVLKVHGGQLKGRGDAALLTGLQQFIQHHTQLIRSMAEQNKYGLQYLVAMRQLNQSAKST